MINECSPLLVSLPLELRCMTCVRECFLKTYDPGAKIVSLGSQSNDV